MRCYARFSHEPGYIGDDRHYKTGRNACDCVPWCTIGERVWPWILRSLGVDGKPRARVSIRADAHHRLMQIARRTGCTKLARVAEYYEDTEFAAAEISSLLAEVEALLDRGIN